MSHAGSPRRGRLFFFLPPAVHLQDLAGPVQVFHEAIGFGAGYDIRFCATAAEVVSAQGLRLAELETLPAIGAGDTLIVAGLDSATLDDLDWVPVNWFRAAVAAGATVGSVCSGAFILGRAGLLDGRECTTHWKVADALQRRHPSARVLLNRLFVFDGHAGRGGLLITSAGVTSGIDMALAMVDADHGPVTTARVAREMVVYMRRGGGSAQASVFLQYRSHLHAGVHRVQDWLTHHVERSPNLDELGQVAGMSPRNLTRLFKQVTGITLKEYATRLKLEVAGNLLRNHEYTVERIAAECGFADSRQLRRLWCKSYGVNPSSWRQREERRLPS